MAAPPAASKDDDLQKLRKQMAKMAKRLAELEKDKKAATLSAEQKNLIKEMIQDSAKNQPVMPNWLDGLTFSGDFRLRMQNDVANKGGGDRNRARFRLRFGFTKKFNDEWLVGFRLASGDSDIATSTNQTMGGAFSKKSIWLDLAYAKYTPKAAPGLVLVAGKMKNPLVTSGLVWDSDVNPEGIAGIYSWGSGNFKPYVAAGWFFGFEGKPGKAHDVTLLAIQGGFVWQISKTAKWTSAVTWYDWEDVGTLNTVNTTKYGNSSGVMAFQTINFTNKLAFAMPNPFSTSRKRIPVGLTLDLIRNCADEETASRWKGNDFGMYAGIKVGQNKKKGDLSANYGYFYIEANATPGYFLDSSFGCANSQGHVFSVTYSVFAAMTVRGQVYLTQPIITPGDSSKDNDISARMELLWKF
ncbi:MAG: hypothetical protein HN909_07150 [Phycisphaerales bacterium]|nr:hypothetical protein [Phycisphaerales bacterium]